MNSFDINIRDNKTYSIVPTEREFIYEGEKTLILLQKIEQVIRGNLEYLPDAASSIVADQAPSFLRDATHGILQKKHASENNFFQKIKSFGSQSRAIEHLGERIEHLFVPPPFLGQIPEACRKKIYSFLPPATLVTLKEVNRTAKKELTNAIIEDAQFLGYKGNSLQEARRYWISFWREFQELCRKDIDEKFIDLPQAWMRNKKGSSRVDIYETFLAMLNAPADELVQGYLKLSGGKTKFLSQFLLKMFREKKVKGALSKDQQKLMHQAVGDFIHHKQWDGLEILLMWGMNPDLVPDGHSECLLHLVCAIKDVAVRPVKLLLQYSATIDARDHQNRSPLFCAIDNNNVAVVQELANGGADVKLEANNKTTPLHRAAFLGFTEIVRILLEKQACITAKNDWDNTPLHLATGDVMEQFMQHEFDVNAINGRGNTFLHRAARKGDLKKFKLLLQKNPQKNVVNISGNTLLHEACKSGNVEIVDLLLNEKMEVNIPNHKGMTPLCMAIKKQHREVVKKLLANGANPNMVSLSNDDSPLHLAVKFQDKDATIVQALVEFSEIQIDVENKEGKTPLALALKDPSKQRSVEILSKKSEMGRVLSSDLDYGQTKWETLMEMVRLGFNPNTRDMHGFTLLYFAVMQTDEDFLLLLDKGADPDAIVLDRAPLNDVSCVKFQPNKIRMLLAKKADPNCFDKRREWRNKAPLHWAVEKKAHDLVRELVDHGARIDVACGEGTPLLLAAKNNDMPLVSFFLEKKVDVNAAVCGVTSLWYAADYGNMEMAQALIDQGADVTTCDIFPTSGRNPIEIAEKRGHKEIAKMLKKKVHKLPNLESSHTFGHYFTQVFNSILAFFQDLGRSIQTWWHDLTR